MNLTTTTRPLVRNQSSQEYAASGFNEIHRYNLGYSIGKFLYEFLIRILFKWFVICNFIWLLQIAIL